MGTGASPQERRTCALEGCEVEFTPTHGQHIFCSRKHTEKARNSRRDTVKLERECEWCGAPFTAIRSTQKFCSVAHSLSAANSRRGGSSQRNEKKQRAEVIAALEAEGFIVHKPIPKDASSKTLDLSHLTGKDRLKLAVVSCTHFGSKYQQPTALREFCEYAAREAKVDGFVHAGDFTDGPTNRHRNPEEVFKHDYAAVRDYGVATLPDTGKPWYVISGNHDDWYALDGGPRIVEDICDKRDDATYLGHSLGHLTFRDTKIEVTHLNTGTGYAYSYKPQKHIESLDPGRKPNVSLIGNFHKFCAIYYRNVLGIQLPSFQRQSAWMAGKSLVSEVGGIIFEIGLTKKGITPVTRFEVCYTFEPRLDDWP